MSEDPPAPDPPADPGEDQTGSGAPRVTRPTPDDFGEWSFPASDPPGTYTWEVSRD